MATAQCSNGAAPPIGAAALNGMAGAINQPVVVDGSKAGILRFCGQTELGPGLWCGVELADGLGECDGCVNQVRYFSCPPNHGIIVRAHNVTLAKAVHSRLSAGISGTLSVASAPHIQQFSMEAQAGAASGCTTWNGPNGKQSSSAYAPPQPAPSAGENGYVKPVENDGIGQDVTGAIPKVASKKGFSRFGSALKRAFNGKKHKQRTPHPAKSVSSSGNGSVPAEKAAPMPECRRPVSEKTDITASQIAAQPMQPPHLDCSSETQTQPEAAQGLVEKLRRELQAKDFLLSAEKSAHDQAMQEKEDLRVQNEMVMERMVFLQSQAEDALSQLRRESTAKIEAVEQCKIFLEKSVASKDGDIEALEKKIKEEQSMTQSREIDIKVLEEKITECQSLLKWKDAEAKTLQKEISEAKALHKSMDTEIQFQRGNIAEKQSILDSKDIEIKDLQSQLADLKTALESGSSAATSYLKAEIDSLKAVYEMKQKECREWREETERLRGVEAANQQLAKQVNALSAKVEQMQFALDERKETEREGWVAARQALERLDTAVEEGKRLSMQNEMLQYRLGEYGSVIAERPLVGYPRTNAV